MLFRPRRGRTGHDRFLNVKMALLGAGGVIALVGFALDIDWLITAAIVVLAIGLGLTLRRRAADDADSDDDPPADRIV